MGGGVYCSTARRTRATTSGYYSKPIEQIFTQSSIDSAMSPKDVKIRESRDTEEHPNSVAIIIGLDVTGSMGVIPHNFVKDGLPTIMGNIIERGIKDPQVLFMGVGDHKCDDAPLQVGQFESSDELLDKWLTSIYIEGNGGGNGGESYFLPWYFAAQHTSIDCFEKRQKKGMLFTIGDEPVHKSIHRDDIKRIMGSGEYADYTVFELLDKARQTYDVYHIHVNHDNEMRGHNVSVWKELLGDSLLEVDDYREIPKLIASTIAAKYGGFDDGGPINSAQPTVDSDEDEEMML